MLWYSEALEPHPGHKSQQYSLHTISCTLLPRRQHPRSQSSGRARPPRRAKSQAQRGQSRWWTGRYHLRTALFSARSTPVAAVSQTDLALRAGRSANRASPRLRLSAAVAAAASLAVPRGTRTPCSGAAHMQPATGILRVYSSIPPPSPPPRPRARAGVARASGGARGVPDQVIATTRRPRASAATLPVQ